MSTRRSLRLPIALGVVMIVLLVVLTIGWIVLSVAGALADTRFAGLYWAVLSVGTTLLILVLVGVVVYLALSIKAINLTRRQSNFIDSVTHELKSPIASLKLYLQTLNRRQVSQKEQESFFQFMLDDVERLDHLINHMLEAGQLEKTPVDADMEDVELAHVLETCATSVCLRYRVPRSVVRAETTRCTVRASRVDLEMIFRNLIDNGVKYAGSHPEVVVTLEVAPSGWTVTRIADNGPGIPKHLRRKIFGRFVRLGMELERKQTGTGLGLYIVRTLVRRLGGTIRVRDRDSGDGTLFEVELPGVALPAEQATRPLPELDLRV
ncbi:MAG: sensor histidine kinase [Pirellulales bacterium]